MYAGYGDAVSPGDGMVRSPPRPARGSSLHSRRQQPPAAAPGGGKHAHLLTAAHGISVPQGLVDEYDPVAAFYSSGFGSADDDPPYYRSSSGAAADQWSSAAAAV